MRALVLVMVGSLLGGVATYGWGYQPLAASVERAESAVSVLLFAESGVVKERQVAPGTAVPVDVVVEWNCRADQPPALAASVRVETRDEPIRTISPVAIRGTPWIESSVRVAPAWADSTGAGVPPRALACPA
jgi:hypothetical protein